MDEFSRAELTEAMATIPKLPPQRGTLDMSEFMVRARLTATRSEEARVIFGNCLHRGTCGTWSAGECGVCKASRLWLEGKYGKEWYLP